MVESTLNKPITVLVTCPDEETATKIARSLTDKRLAACINITSKVKSIYRWEGKVEEADEHLLIIKSKRKLLKKIVEDVKANHPYKTPEVISLQIVGGSKEYIDWIMKETS
ncbi:divalent-cation tolerance protein CutA [Candidatus Bathyarchaeota archaeon]|nr:divalent-cation tolerance protein CutA [Candidatus Bathyarchaeota archaeon]